nr:hypothetical protein [uncultured Rhodopila sp.]
MSFHLVVTKPFLGFVRGDVIADAAKMNEILASDHKKSVNRVASPDSSKG